MKLIDADELKEHLFQNVKEQGRTVASCKNRTDDEVNEYRIGWNDALKAVAVSAPTVDAVPVVRCKECKHFKFIYDYLGRCECLSLAMLSNDFCSRGERKEETEC